jgi:iron complex outermembrane recepter protein
MRPTPLVSLITKISKNETFNVWLLLQLMVVAALGQHNLKGVVTGNGEPLPGASIVIENTFYGVSAKSDGSFEFRNLKKGNYILKASFVGFETQEIPVKVPEIQQVSFQLNPCNHYDR